MPHYLLLFLLLLRLLPLLIFIVIYRRVIWLNNWFASLILIILISLFFFVNVSPNEAMITFLFFMFEMIAIFLLFTLIVEAGIFREWDFAWVLIKIFIIIFNLQYDNFISSSCLLLWLFLKTTTIIALIVIINRFLAIVECLHYLGMSSLLCLLLLLIRLSSSWFHFLKFNQINRCLIFWKRLLLFIEARNLRRFLLFTIANNIIHLKIAFIGHSFCRVAYSHSLGSWI